MNYRITLAITAIVAAAALASVAFAVPQEATASKHSTHNSNGVKVNQLINQQNQCSGPTEEEEPGEGPFNANAAAASTSASSTTCANLGSNSAIVGH
jgi:hypothetical protein